MRIRRPTASFLRKLDALDEVFHLVRRGRFICLLFLTLEFLDVFLGHFLYLARNYKYPPASITDDRA